MKDYRQLSRDYDRVEQAIQFLEQNFHRQPSLAEIAASATLSEFHFQRLFSRWVGISPKRFLQFLTKEYAKKLIDKSKTILDVTYDSGLSSPSRLHDFFVTCEAVTPGEYKNKGAGIKIAYGFQPSPFGRCLLAITERGICGLRFVRDGNEKRLVSWVNNRWPQACLAHQPDLIQPLIDQIFDCASADKPVPLHLYLRGTNFQIKVWEALLEIPFGRAVTYEDIAQHIGWPKAARAVGNAVGQNPIPFLIPCHRVIRKTGDFGNYGEGPARKKAILGWEAAQSLSV
ncbi:MAG: bifunctional helix-turn-helix domain-containing protein/methylated-DNA--[protein]-cysteine S-methyltransferase [Desulfobacterales bacterium]|nr:MAG: bifunctional helix-turn-helix domain-containing protein/methylated-DNA--[protein]-cysteine S-methyltransferase [Desulfobacterales bacterium]